MRPREKRKNASPRIFLTSAIAACGAIAVTAACEAKDRQEICYEDTQSYLDMGCRIESNPLPILGCSQGVVTIHCPASIGGASPASSRVDDTSSSNDTVKPRRKKKKDNNTKRGN